MTAIEFNLWEAEMFRCSMAHPEDVKYIPKCTFDRFFQYLLQEERYEDIHKLEIIKVTIKSITTDPEWVN